MTQSEENVGSSLHRRGTAFKNRRESTTATTTSGKATQLERQNEPQNPGKLLHWHSRATALTRQQAGTHTPENHKRTSTDFILDHERAKWPRVKDSSKYQKKISKLSAALPPPYGQDGTKCLRRNTWAALRLWDPSHHSVRNGRRLIYHLLQAFIVHAAKCSSQCYHQQSASPSGPHRPHRQTLRERDRREGGGRRIEGLWYIHSMEENKNRTYGNLRWTERTERIGGYTRERDRPAQERPHHWLYHMYKNKTETSFQSRQRQKYARETPQRQHENTDLEQEVSHSMGRKPSGNTFVRSNWLIVH